MDGTSFLVEVIGGTLEGGGGRGGVLAADADAGDAAGNGEEPEHVVRGVNLEGQGGEERADDDEGGGEEHAALSREFVRCVAED